MAASIQGGVEALHRLKSTEPPIYLSPSPDLSESARLASHYIFSTLKPFTPKLPFDQLLIDGFDAEQIWQQIDLQSKPLISTLRRQVEKFGNSPDEISKLFGGKKAGKKIPLKSESDGVVGLDEDMEEEFDLDNDQDEDEFEEGGESESEEDPDEEEDGDEEDGGVGIEDKFLKINELEDYLEEDEAREYGLARKKKKGDGEVPKEDESSDEDEFDDGGGLNEEEEEEEDEDNLGLFGAGMDDEGDEELGNVRYDDFFAPQKKNVHKKKSKPVHDSDDKQEDDKVLDMDTYDEQEDDEVLDNPKQNLSTHEKEQENIRSKIEQMEKANLEPRTWTMQGEVTAAKRPKNSALEVDLDFEHNVRPAPVITEEVTASLEDLIKKRILEGRFDDVQRAPALPSRAPKEIKEMDENKSKKGLAEIYEDEYVQKTGLVSAALSFSDEQKKAASLLFKKICFKLDALSHFHFTPKPVIEDMSIQVNVPALAMEEIAPLAVSDAAMLAPEEVFGGKGDIKEEAELTQEERRRRRANKKRKFKAVADNVTAVKKARDSALQDQNHANGGKIES